MKCSKCYHGVIRSWTTQVICCKGLPLFGFSCSPVINDHECDGLADSETGQVRAAALCSPAKHSLDAVESRYARPWVLVRHLTPTPMMTGCGFRPNYSPMPSFSENIETIKDVGATQSGSHNESPRVCRGMVSCPEEWLLGRSPATGGYRQDRTGLASLSGGGVAPGASRPTRAHSSGLVRPRFVQRGGVEGRVSSDEANTASHTAHSPPDCQARRLPRPQVRRRTRRQDPFGWASLDCETSSEESKKCVQYI